MSLNMEDSEEEEDYKLLEEIVVKDLEQENLGNRFLFYCETVTFISIKHSGIFKTII